MNITDILSKETIAISLVVEDKTELLNKMVDLAALSGKITNKENAKREIYIREMIMSTGIGKGIALPHAKSNSVTDTIGALAILKEPIDYNALDGNKVQIVFLLIGRENNVGNHLRLLSRISRLLDSDEFRETLLSIKSPEQALELFRKAEEEE